MSRVIQLTQGKKAVVDDDDFERLSQHSWCFNIKSGSHGYAHSARVSFIKENNLEWFKR